jgi:hypothetical protein
MEAGGMVGFLAMRTLVLSLAMIASLVSAAPKAPSKPLDAHAVIVRMLGRDPSLRSYRTRVHVDTRMFNFPFYSPKLDGTTYFKRPARYEIVFDHVPRFAAGFSQIFTDIGDPSAWEKLQNVSLDGDRTVNGHRLLALRLTKKIYSTILDYALALVDPTSYELMEMDWHYRSGGTIVMTQSYRTEGPYTVIGSQHANISIPHVHAVADAMYAPYQTNVPVDDSVFVTK